MSIYTLQETIEGSLSPGHPGGTIGVYGNGGWTAVFLSLAIGALIALLLRGSQAVLIALAGAVWRRAGLEPHVAAGRSPSKFSQGGSTSSPPTSRARAPPPSL